MAILIAGRSVGTGRMEAKDGSVPPRLVYMGDVPVEATYHGSALLYRLLQDYPKERLSVFEAGTTVSLPERRIVGTDYHDLRLPLERMSRTRFWGCYRTVALKLAKYRANLLLPRFAELSPEAILTVSHGYSWITAAALAQRLDVPLHLICHDEWVLPGTMMEWKDRVFRDIYRQAKSRMCVSPFMVEEYERRYKVSGAVLYPSRSSTNPAYDMLPMQIGPRPLTGAFGGAALHNTGNRLALSLVSDALLRVGGKLMIYGPYKTEDLSSIGLTGPHVFARGLLNSADLIETMRREVDFLIAPMSFSAIDRPSVSSNFPSKLTDYTAAALPILALAPPYSSLANWCRREPSAALLVEMDEPKAVELALRTLASRAAREQYAIAASKIGLKYFSPRAAAEVFAECLEGGRSVVAKTT